jgi:hypothetical protein
MANAADVTKIKFDDQRDKIGAELTPAKWRRLAALTVAAMVGRNYMEAIEAGHDTVPAAGMKTRCVGQEYERLTGRAPFEPGDFRVIDNGTVLLWFGSHCF